MQIACNINSFSHDVHHLSLVRFDEVKKSTANMRPHPSKLFISFDSSENDMASIFKRKFLSDPVDELVHILRKIKLVVDVVKYLSDILEVHSVKLVSEFLSRHAKHSFRSSTIINNLRLMDWPHDFAFIRILKKQRLLSMESGTEVVEFSRTDKLSIREISRN